MMYIDVAEVAVLRIAERHPGLTGQPSFGLALHLGFLPRASRRSARSAGVRNVGAAGYRITLSSCLRCAGGPADISESVPLIHLPLRRIVVVLCREDRLRASTTTWAAGIGLGAF